MIIREARPTDLQKMIKVASPAEVYGCVAEDDGEVLGGGWVIWGLWGRPWAVLHSSDRLKRMPVSVTRAMIAGIREASKYVPEIYARAENERLLLWLGFEPTGEIIGDERVFKWQRQ